MREEGLKIKLDEVRFISNSMPRRSTGTAVKNFHESFPLESLP